MLRLRIASESPEVAECLLFLVGRSSDSVLCILNEFTGVLFCPPLGSCHFVLCLVIRIFACSLDRGFSSLFCLTDSLFLHYSCLTLCSLHSPRLLNILLGPLGLKSFLHRGPSILLHLIQSFFCVVVRPFGGCKSIFETSLLLR